MSLPGTGGSQLDKGRRRPVRAIWLLNEKQTVYKHGELWRPNPPPWNAPGWGVHLDVQKPAGSTAFLALFFLSLSHAPVKFSGRYLEAP